MVENGGSGGNVIKEENQETYLTNTPLKKIVLRGIKKLVTEISSIKTLAMAAFIGLNYFGKMGDMATLLGVLSCLGAKEVDFSLIVNSLQSKLSK